MEIAVQVAGKVRAKIVVAKDASKEDIEEVALADSKVQGIYGREKLSKNYRDSRQAC